MLELLLVLVILAILLTVALPGYRQSVLRANRAVAKLTLLEVAARQERHLQTHKRYAASLVPLGFGENYFIDGAASPVAAEAALYRIALLLEEDRYSGVIASPQNRQLADAECGSFIYRLDGQRQVSGRWRGDPGRCW